MYRSSIRMALEKKKMWKRVKAKAGWKKTEVEEGRVAQTSWW